MLSERQAYTYKPIRGLMLEAVIVKFHKFFWNAMRCTLEEIGRFGRQNLEEVVYSVMSVSL